MREPNKCSGRAALTLRHHSRASSTTRSFRTTLIEFDPASIIALNVIIATMMFGVAISLRPADFRSVARAPKAPVIGLLAQFVVLPAATCLATWAARVPADLALGMILVACCPGGNFSNILTWLGRGNVATSVSMTAVSSVAATVLTPLNFALYSGLNPYTRALATDIAISGVDLLTLMSLVLGLPLALGMLVAHLLPALAARLQNPFRYGSIAVLLLLVGIGFATNLDVFRHHADRIVGLATLHNVSALLLGAAAGWLAHLPKADRRAVTMEVGVQNTGLGLIILFNFYPNQASMILITAFWGVPHLVTGLGLCRLWVWQDGRKRD